MYNNLINAINNNLWLVFIFGSIITSLCFIVGYRHAYLSGFHTGRLEEQRRREQTDKAFGIKN